MTLPDSEVIGLSISPQGVPSPAVMKSAYFMLLIMPDALPVTSK